MKFAYYPGCSARSTCAELNEATHRVAEKLGLELTQLESATCTGARELRAIDLIGFFTLNLRILALAEREGLPLMTVCNTCTLNLLDAHAAFVGDPELAIKVNETLTNEGLRYSGRTRISHFSLGPIRGHRSQAATRTCDQAAQRAYSRCLLRLPHHAPAATVRLHRFAQQYRIGASRRAAGLPSDRLQRANRMLWIPYRRP